MEPSSLALALRDSPAPHRASELQPLAPSRMSGRARPPEWSRAYYTACLLVALLVATSPLLGLAAHELWRATRAVAAAHDAACDAGVRVVDAVGLNASRPPSVALLTHADDGPHGEARRLARLSLQNKRAYAARHGYALYVVAPARPECGRRGGSSLALLALEQLAERRAHEWLFWLDADVLLVEQAAALPGALRGALAHAARAAPPLVVSSGDERGLSLAALVLAGQSAGARCLLAHAIALRTCSAREAGGLGAERGLPALLLLLRPREPRELECIRQHAPRECADPASAGYLSDVTVLPREVLNGEPASYREGGFTVHIPGCMVGRRTRSLRWCEATYATFQNLSRGRRTGAARGAQTRALA
ncbi:hypothetical protein AB1Y20_023307 [Prymnesium parvum]|uniref:Uncharacterized protein n=1 Tax=Prymnesium parvum TaxID=97485 RepID=A0AB34JDP6_PRYPA